MKEEIKQRYNELYRLMAASGDASKMKVFGKAEKWAFCRMLELSEEDAKRWLDKLESTEWNNYLSKEEAESIVEDFVNQDGTHGAHWSYQTLKEAVEGLGNYLHEEPFYNCYALWVTMNMLYSDHAISLSEYVEESDMFKLIYRMAEEKLKDRDREQFIRKYFEI